MTVVTVGNSPRGLHQPFHQFLQPIVAPKCREVVRRNYSTVFLRRHFEVPNTADITEFHASVDFDDGFIMWINGREVARFQVPSDPGQFVPFDETATRSHSPGEYEDFPLEVEGVLENGTNVVAVQMFNVSISSNDVKFDADLLDPFGPDMLRRGRWRSFADVTLGNIGCYLSTQTHRPRILRIALSEMRLAATLPAVPFSSSSRALAMASFDSSSETSMASTRFSDARTR